MADEPSKTPGTPMAVSYTHLVGEHIVLVQNLHHPQADPRSQQEYQSGPPSAGVQADVLRQPDRRDPVQKPFHFNPPAYGMSRILIA